MVVQEFVVKKNSLSCGQTINYLINCFLLTLECFLFKNTMPITPGNTALGRQ